MPRWEPGSENRLRNAALELFEEQGFDATSVVEISARAGVTNRTFFRYFPDKREVLFAATDDLRTVLAEQILEAPEVTEPLQAVTGILAQFDWGGLGPRDFQRRRHAVIAANPELLERDLSKHHDIAVGFADALRQRGIDPETAQLAGRVGVQVFLTAYGHWLESGDEADLATISRRLTSTLATILPTGATPA